MNKSYLMAKTNEDEYSETLFAEFDEIIESLSIFKSQINLIQQRVKDLEKNMKKHVKVLKRGSVKNKNKGPRKPSGFAKPSQVTKELCEFMNKNEGTELARTEVTRALVSYIKEHNLQNKENSKIIHADEKLKNLLELDDSDELTYFNLQKYMNKHFISYSK